MSEYFLELPDDFADYAWELEAKGWFPEAFLNVSGKRYRIMFYDPLRLAQEIESEHERGNVFFEQNLVIVKRVTKSSMEEAVENLVQSNRVPWLLAE
jgi:hypothetical protein